MRQAPGFDGLSFDPFSFSQNGLAAPEVDNGRGVLQALVIAPVIVMIDKGIDLLPEITGQVVVFQQDAVLQGLVPSLDLALGLRMIWGAPDMIHLPVFQPISQFTRDVTRSVVAEQPRLVQNCRLITTRRLQRQVQRVGLLRNRLPIMPGMKMIGRMTWRGQSATGSSVISAPSDRWQHSLPNGLHFSHWIGFGVQLNFIFEQLQPDLAAWLAHCAAFDSMGFKPQYAITVRRLLPGAA